MSQYIDKSWINKPRNTEAYIKGLVTLWNLQRKGHKMVSLDALVAGVKLIEKKILLLEEVERYILFKEFYKEYKDWIFHGPMTVVENV